MRSIYVLCLRDLRHCEASMMEIFRENHKVNVVVNLVLTNFNVNIEDPRKDSINVAIVPSSLTY